MRCCMIALCTSVSIAAVAQDELPDVSTSSAEVGLWDRVETWADESRTFGRDSLHAEYQFDTRGFNTVHLMGSARLPAGFNLWGFVDFEAGKNAGGSRGDSASFFYEIDLRRKVWRDFGIVAEVNDAAGSRNALVRAGLFYMPSCAFLSENATFLLVKGFAYESDDKGGQVSLALNKGFPGFLDGRLSAGGFVDVNIDSGRDENDANVVTEWQVRFRVLGGLHALAELRFNEFLSAGRDLGAGLGFRYAF